MGRPLDPRKPVPEPDVERVQAQAVGLLREALDLLTQVELASLSDDQVGVAESRALHAIEEWVNGERTRMVGRMATRALMRQR